MTKPRLNIITESIDLTDYTQCKIEDLIAKLQQVALEHLHHGDIYFNAELDTHPYGDGDFVRLEATYKRLETDAEYDARVRILAHAKEHRRALYEQLKSEFDEAVAS